MKTITLLNKNMSQASFKRIMHGGKRGSALITVIGVTFVIVAMTVTLLSFTSNAIRSNNRQQLRAAALNIAESGAEEAILWLRDQAIPPNSDVVPSIGSAPQNSTWNVVIYSDPSNANEFLKTYRIVSTGTVNTVSRSVEIVVRQATFGKYAYFTDKETASGGGSIWWSSKDSIDGPVHSNNSSSTNFNIDYSGWSANYPRRPIFFGPVTASGSSISYNPSRPRTESDYQKVFSNGSKGYTLGVPKINLPPSTNTQKEAAWGTGTAYPSTDGVYLRADNSGGIYIRGNAAITMSVDASGNQLMTVVQGTKTTVVTFNINAGTVSMTGAIGSGSATSASSFPNGVIYCTGNITALSGTIADNKVSDGEITRASSWTIATDTNAAKDITITGDLVYNTRPDKALDASAACNLAAGTLGLVGQDVKIASVGTSYSHPNREIDAVMLAGSPTVAGSISVNNYSSGSTGTLKVIGGLIQSTRGAVGTLSNGIINHGYQKDYHYDPRLASYPPPFYPTTGQYDRLSWKVLPQ